MRNRLLKVVYMLRGRVRLTKKIALELDLTLDASVVTCSLNMNYSLLRKLQKPLVKNAPASVTLSSLEDQKK